MNPFADWPALTAALIIVFLAGLSEGMGTQGVILLLNRISPGRFVINMIFSALTYVASALLWVAMLWLVARLVFNDDVSFRETFITVSAAYTPLLLSGLSLLPYLGLLISRILRLWSLLIALFSIGAAFALPLWQASLCALLGWALLELLRYLLSLPVERFARSIWRLTTGREARMGFEDLPQVIAGYGAGERGQ